LDGFVENIVSLKHRLAARRCLIRSCLAWKTCFVAMSFLRRNRSLRLTSSVVKAMPTKTCCGQKQHAVTDDVLADLAGD
jgi:hypothetical protein